MKTHYKVLRLFIFWLFFVTLMLVTYVMYFGPIELQIIQVGLLGSLVALSVIYFGVRATQFGKHVVAMFACGWLLGTNIYFGLVGPSMDVRLSMLILLAISLALNVALSVIIKKKALR